ncbi:hypothetical protein EV360DRAFT_74147 [Lentinula raphanica]|nr:hypothetical protein EV360DRAFT_74147 [Lentinula raphanica]
MEGICLEDRMESMLDQEWDPTRNPQTEWESFQWQFTEIEQARAKVVIPKIDREVDITESQIDTIGCDPQLGEDERMISVTMLKEKLASLEQQRHRSTRATTKARNAVYGETISRYWSQQNKSKTPRQPLLRLELPLPPNPNSGNVHQQEPDLPTEPVRTYETHSQRMANMMWDQHTRRHRPP